MAGRETVRPRPRRRPRGGSRGSRAGVVHGQCERDRRIRQADRRCRQTDDRARAAAVEAALRGQGAEAVSNGSGARNAFTLEFAGAPHCGSANACFLASFQGTRGGKLPGKSNLELAGGQPAFYKGITCGASCSPATLWFLNRGVLYTWQHNDPPKNTKSVLARLAAQAIAAGPR